MTNISYTKIFAKNWEIIALLAAVAIVLSLVFSVLQPFEFKASTKLLVIQDQMTNLDTFTATKSAEKVGKNLTQVVGTSVFYNEVFDLNPSLEALFPADALEKRQEWQRDVQVAIIPDTGILSVEAYNENKVKSAELVQAIAAILVTQSDEFHGAGEQIKVKVIDDVFVSRYPVRPNIMLNVLFAAILGLIVGAVFVVLNEARKIKLTQKSLFEAVEAPVQKASEVSNVFRGIQFQPILETIPERPYEPVVVKETNPLSEAAKSWKIIEESK